MSPTQPEWTVGVCGGRTWPVPSSLLRVTLSVTFKADPCHGNGAQRRLGWTIAYVWASTQGRQPVSFVTVYIPLRGERTQNENQSINQCISMDHCFWVFFVAKSTVQSFMPVCTSNAKRSIFRFLSVSFLVLSPPKQSICLFALFSFYVLHPDRTTESKKDSGHGCPPPPAAPDRRNHMVKRPRRDTRQRKGRCSGRKSSREGCLVAHYIPSLHEATDIREVPEKQDEMGRGPSPPWQRRNLTSSGKEVLHGPSQKLHRTDGCTNQDRPLAVRSVH
jgi:hypothetical protein